MGDATTIRPFEDSDTEEVLEVLRAALGEPPLLPRTPELFAWKHLINPFGRSLMWVAETDGRISGVRTFMRWQLVTPGGQTVSCVRAVDTATHPDFLRMGIFRRLTEHALEAAKDEGVQLVFNTPNERSGPGYLAMGWQRVGPLAPLVRPSFRSLIPKHKARGVPRLREFLRDGSPPTELTIEDRPPQGLRTPRSPAYLQWRFCQHPTARYVALRKEDGMAVVRPNIRNGRRELVVSDIFGPPSAALRAVSTSSLADYQVAWFSPSTRERRAVLRRGFVTVPRVGLTLLVNPLVELDLDVTSFPSWDLATSDLELL